MRRLFFKGRQSEELFHIKGNKETYNKMQYVILDWIQFCREKYVLKKITGSINKVGTWMLH